MPVFKSDLHVLAVIVGVLLLSLLWQIWMAASLQTRFDRMHDGSQAETKVLLSEISALKDTVLTLQKQVVDLEGKIAAPAPSGVGPATASDQLGARMAALDVKTAAVREALETAASELKSETGEIKTELGHLRTAVAEVKTGVGEAKAAQGEVSAAVSGLRAEAGDVKAAQGEVMAAVSELKTDAGEIKIAQREMQTAVGALKTDVSEAKVLQSEVRTTVSGLKDGLDAAKTAQETVQAAVSDLTKVVQEQAKPTAPPPVVASKAETFQIFFEDRGSFGGDWLRGEVAKRVADINTFIGERKDCTIAAEGHADTVGPDVVNIELSRRRAVSVTDLLREMMPDADIGAPNWAGERRLLVATPDRTSEGRNRRVDITVRCGAGQS